MSAPDPKEPEVYTPEPGDQPQVYYPEPGDQPQVYYPEPGEQQVYYPEAGAQQVYYPEGGAPAPGASADEEPEVEPTDALGRMRREYTRAGLLEASAGYEPFALFNKWFAEATESKVPEPNAMTLATVGRDGHPSARIVLLKGVDDRGFVFYTNYLSRKGEELASRPRAALVFFWPELERQVRVEGVVEQVSAAESDAYFASRPMGSRLGAWASQQSKPAGSREELDRALEARRAEFEPMGAVPRPPHWGGYRVVPEVVEFWQGRRNRMHDRLRFRRAGLRWLRERLNP